MGWVKIGEIAEQAGLQLKPVSRYRPDQVKADHCPFCGDIKGNLELNLDKDLFHCWACDSKGGVIAFYAKLHGLSETVAKQKLYPHHRTRKLHPAERLTTAQLQEIGFQSLHRHPKTKPARMSHEEWAAYRKRQLDWIWQTWCEHVQTEQEIERRLARLFATQEQHPHTLQSVNEHWMKEA